MKKPYTIIFFILLLFFLVSCNLSLDNFNSGIGNRSNSGGITNNNSSSSSGSKWLQKNSTGTGINNNQNKKTSILSFNNKLRKLKNNELVKLDCNNFMTGITTQEIKRCESLKKRAQKSLERKSK
ncbi:MAG: hypothetical protein PHZ26_03065 [Candidatus Gracilibacteria bacterium]|nr:hypothetical protein [Candidatus Gracilibacteria bacterium]MDD2908708.1 hypothetical protein [Candidatus Gracilibacteria bacterium]